MYCLSFLVAIQAMLYFCMVTGDASNVLQLSMSVKLPPLPDVFHRHYFIEDLEFFITAARQCLPVVRPTIEVMGKGYILDSRRVPTLQPIATNICTGHYVS